MKISACFAFVMLLFVSCKKEEQALKPLDYSLTYEVITSSGNWFGEYNDSTGARVATGMEMPSGWRYSYRLNSMPHTMFIGASSTCTCRGTATSPDVTINFYSNGVLFKTEKNKWAKGVNSLEFKIEVSVP